MEDFLHGFLFCLILKMHHRCPAVPFCSFPRAACQMTVAAFNLAVFSDPLEQAQNQMCQNIDLV
jgi:hypothetical protein